MSIFRGVLGQFGLQLDTILDTIFELLFAYLEYVRAPYHDRGLQQRGSSFFGLLT